MIEEPHWLWVLLWRITFITIGIVMTASPFVVPILVFLRYGFPAAIAATVMSVLLFKRLLGSGVILIWGGVNSGFPIL